MGICSIPWAWSQGWRRSLRGDQATKLSNEESHIQWPWGRIYLSPHTWADPLMFHTQHRGVSLAPCNQGLPTAASCFTRAESKFHIPKIWQSPGTPQLPHNMKLQDLQGSFRQQDNLNTAVKLHPKIKMLFPCYVGVCSEGFLGLTRDSSLEQQGPNIPRIFFFPGNSQLAGSCWQVLTWKTCQWALPSLLSNCCYFLLIPLQVKDQE